MKRVILSRACTKTQVGHFPGTINVCLSNLSSYETDFHKDGIVKLTL